MEFLEWLQNTGLGEWMRTDSFGSPLVLCAHSIGMAGVVGIVYVLGLRVLGFAKGIPLEVFDRLASVGWAAFFLNAASGVLLFMGDATHLVANWTFWLKLALIAAGGLALWVLGGALAGQAGAPASPRVATARAKAVATVCLALWTGALISGRYIAYTLADQRQKELEALIAAPAETPPPAPLGISQ